MTQSSTSTIGGAREARAARARPLAAGRLLLALPRWVVAQRKRSRVAAQLERLTDRELSDIGILRVDIPRVVRGKTPG